MAFTKVTGPGIHTLANITSHNINSSGIITATKFVGPLEASSGSTGTFDSLTVTGNVSVGGTLTYEDVTNIDSVGIITARELIDANNRIDVVGGANIDQVNVTGVSSYAGLVDVNNRIDVVGGVNADQVNVSGVSTFSDHISVADTKELKFGSSAELKLSNNGTAAYIQHTGSGYLFIHGNDLALRSVSQKNYIVCDSDNEVTLYFNNNEKLATTGIGVTVYGNTETQTLNVTGVSTFAGITTVTSNTLFTKQINSTGIVTASAFKLTDGSNVGGTDSDAQGNTLGGTNAGDSFSGTSAIKNTLFGYNSGTAITSGDQNTSFGYDALKTMATTESNTAVGFEALKVATGDLGSAFGSGALAADSGNGYNSAFGASAGGAVTSGSDNSFLGYTAGSNLETGNYNICLGAWSRTSATGVSRECTIGGNQSSRITQTFRIPGIGLTITGPSAVPYPLSGSQLHLSGHANFVGVVTATNHDLSAIDKSISDTAVDIFVYDTRKDSDGGAWRKRTSHTTWYNETFSATRGSKKEFPAVAVIVAENDTLTIYDGDDPEMPMWMVFLSGGTNGARMAGRSNEHNVAIHMLNGLLCLGRDYFGLHMINFIDDRARFKEAGYDTPYLMPIGTHRNGSNVWALDPTNEGNDLSEDKVNDIAMTVLPNSPIDASTGLPIPTIAVATNIGVTVMTTDNSTTTTWENGKTWDVYMGNTSYDTVSTVQFTKDGKVVYTDHNGSQYGWMYVHDIPHKDTAITVNTQSTALSWYDTRDDGTNGHGFADQDGHIYSSTAGYGVKILHTVTAPDNMIYATTTSGVTMIQENRSANRSGLVAYVTHLYNTGWLHGDQKLCLSDINDTNKTNTQTEYDRSIAAKNFTVYGTVYKTAVATGAEMVSWSFGDSNANYLKQDYNAQLQFGTSSFSVMTWFKMSNLSSTGFIFDRADSSGGERIAWYMESDDLKLYTHDGSSSSEIGNGTVEIGSNHDGKWVFAVSTRHSSGLMETYINGVLRHSQVSAVRNVDNGDAHLIVGGRYNNSSGQEFNGEIALLRMSKSVPSPEQVAKIYNDEKDLFIDNAKCALYGSSSSITALAHDEDTDTLHVGTSGGRSDFTGLNRINNTTTAVTTVISASNGLIIEQ